MTEDNQLWALHVEGPDDMHAAPSREIAERVAERMQTYWDSKPHHESEPMINFNVVPWPYSAVGHASSLRLWSVYFGDDND